MAHKVANVVPGGMAIMAADPVAGDLANRVAEKVAIQVDDGGLAGVANKVLGSVVNMVAIR